MVKNDDVIEVLHRVLDDRVSLNHYVAEERNIKNAVENKNIFYTNSPQVTNQCDLRRFIFIYKYKTHTMPLLR